MVPMQCSPRTTSLLTAVALLALAACGADDAADDTAPTVASSPASSSPVPTGAASTVPATSPAATTEVVTTEPAATTEGAMTEPTTGVTPTEASPPSSTTPRRATTTAGPAPTVPAPVVELARDGLGIVAFGTEADAAVAALSEELGDPTNDTGWVDPLEVSACAGIEVRRVDWGALTILLGDPAGETTEIRELFSYAYGDVSDISAEPVGLLTPEGVGVGMSVGNLRVAYPAVTIEPGEEGLIEPTFFVDQNLRGLVTGDADSDIVTVIVGGPYCG